MDRPPKSLVRLTLSIHRALVASDAPRRQVELPLGVWRRATDLVRRIRRAELQRWNLAAATLREELKHKLTTLQAQLIELERSLSTTSLDSYQAQPTDICQDLISLEEHFESMSFDVREQLPLRYNRTDDARRPLFGAVRDPARSTKVGSRVAVSRDCPRSPSGRFAGGRYASPCLG